MISGAVRDELISRYREPHRRYHTMAHIEDCLGQVEASTDLTTDQRALLEAAIWFHDAIYDPTRNDNEAESARLARERLAAGGAAGSFVDEVERLILLTAGHSVGPDDPLGARLVSIDLSILGSEPAQSFKPVPKVYLTGADWLGLQPSEVMMVAAHNNDLRAARALGFRTASAQDGVPLLQHDKSIVCCPNSGADFFQAFGIFENDSYFLMMNTSQNHRVSEFFSQNTEFVFAPA